MELHLRRKRAEEEGVPPGEEGGGLLARRRQRREQKRLEEEAGPEEALEAEEGAEEEQEEGGRRGLRRLVPWGRAARGGAEEESEEREEEPGVVQAVGGRALSTVRGVGRRGRDAVVGLRERVPSGAQLRTGAAEARDWAADQLGEHAMAVGLGVLTAGVVAAALLPTSAGERRALALAARKSRSLGRAVTVGRQLAPLAQAARERMAHAGGPPEAEEAREAEEAPEERRPRKEARARARPQPRKEAAARGKAPARKAAHAARKAPARKSAKTAGKAPAGKTARARTEARGEHARGTRRSQAARKSTRETSGSESRSP